MIDLLLLVGFIISAGLLIRIETSDSNKLFEAKPAVVKKPSWNPLMVISNKHLRQAGVYVKTDIVLIYCLKGSALFTTYIALQLFPLELDFSSILMISGLAFFLPDMWFYAKRSSRQAAIENTLEFFLRVLLVYMRAGFNFERAFALAANHGLSKKHPLAVELKLFIYEIEAGSPRNDAFKALYERTGVKGVKRLANLMSIGVELGTSLTQAVEAQLQTFTLQRGATLAKKVNKKALHTTFPIILISFPMFLVLVFFPAALQVLTVLKLLVSNL